MTSGAVYPGVPKTTSSPSVDSTGRARPKSPILGRVFGSRRMFAGLMSRWRMPASWAWARPLQMPRARRPASFCSMALPWAEWWRDLPVHELHDDVGHAVDLAEVVDADEVRVVELGHGLGLGLEAAAEVLRRRRTRGEDLDGDVAVEGVLAGLVDGPHAALGDEGVDVVGGQEFLDFGGVGGLEQGLGGHEACGESVVDAGTAWAP